MAREIQVNAQLSCKKGAFVFPTVGGRVQVTQNGLGGGAPGIMVVGPAAELVDLSEISVPGYVYLKNIDSHQTIVWGPNNAGSLVPIGELRPGEQAVWRMRPGAALRVQVDAASEESGSTSAENQAKLQIYVMED